MEIRSVNLVHSNWPKKFHLQTVINVKFLIYPLLF